MPFGSAKCMRSIMAIMSHREGAKVMLPSVSLQRKPVSLEFQRGGGGNTGEGGREIATKCSVPPELFGKITKQQLHMPHINYV